MYEELEKNVNSPYLVLLEENIEDIILSEKRDQCNAMRSRVCTDSFAANATAGFVPRMCCNTYKKHDKTEPVVFRDEYRYTEMQIFCSKTYCCCNQKSNKY